MIIILRESKAVLIVLLLSACLQVSIALLPSVGDAFIYSQWMRVLADEGLTAAYWDKPIASEQGTTAYYRIDYPPLYPYLLGIQGVALKTFAPASVWENDTLIKFWVKIPLIAGNLFLCFLIYKIVRRKENSKTAVLSASAFGFNPAVIYITCFWGQSDSLCALLLLLSCLLISDEKPELAWFCITLAVFTKPIAYPFALFLLIATASRFGWKRVLPCMLYSAVVSIIILLPFLTTGRFQNIVWDLLIQIDTMPWISANAHNLWWIVSGGLPWVDSNSKIAGAVTYKTIGIILYATFLIITFWKYRRSANSDAVYFVFASIAFGLFSLSTHMHAYHLFYALALIPILLTGIPRLRMFYVLLTITSFLNMVLYDVYFIYLTKAGMYLTMLNSQLCLGIFLFWLASYYFENGFDPLFETKWKSRISPAILVVAGLPIFFLTASPFVRKASTFQTEHYLLTEFNSAVKEEPSSDFIRKDVFMIQNDLRPVLYQHPPSEVTYRFRVPSRAVLSFGICLSPAVWNPQKGDGVRFEIRICNQNRTEVLFNKYIDPKNIPSDRKWHEETVDLSKYKERDVQLILSVYPGPSNDSRYDWAAWGDPRIVISNE